MAERGLCVIDGCGKPHEARGWCRAHYRRWQRSGSPHFDPPASKPKCTIDGCDRPQKAQGYCDPHYRRLLRHGTPTAGVAIKGEPERFLLDVAAKFRGEECLLWPYGFGSHGYGSLTFRGKSGSAHRFVCAEVHGEPPTPQHDAAHSCGIRGCVNPAHLRWATRSENAADMVEHGTHHRGERQWCARLTEDDVRAIRRLKGKRTAYSVAKDFGVSAGAIHGIFNGQTWAWLE